MQLPPALQWIEIDLPEILAYKEKILAGEKPTCRLERMRLDLSDVNGRKPVFTELAARARKILVLTEGLIIYLDSADVVSLAKDLAAQPQFQRWILDLHSPGLLRMMQRTTGKQLSQVGAPFKFAASEGPLFFEPYGWKAVDVQGLLKTAARFKRPPFGLRLLSYLPESKGAQGSRPWSGVCLFARNVGP
jgi:O-methyltransferase involved in polyketide biosynthesis